MKSLAILAVLAVALPASANGPLRASLMGYQEVPAVSTVAMGEFEARVSNDEQSVDWVLVYDGLQADVQQAHIHVAQKSVNGSIVVWLCGTTGTLAGPPGTATCPGRSGTVRGTFTAANVINASITSQQITAGELAEVIAAMRAGVAYANIHTTASPGGEIRGQISARGDSGR
jgi:hypothetical protein